MNPVTQSLPAAGANSGRSASASNDAGRGANFASLISSLSAANPQPATQPPQQSKPAQANGKPNASQNDQAVQDPAANANPAQPQAAGPAATPAQAHEEAKDEEKDETKPAAEQAGAIDPAAQLLALTQEAQSLAQAKQSAAGETRDGAGDLAGAARAHAARGAQKTEPLAAAGREDALAAGAGRDAADADTGFADRIAAALTLHAEKPAQAEDALTPLQSRQDTPAPQATPQALAGAQLRAAQSLAAARAAGDQLAPRVGAAGWDRALGQKVVWMVGQGEQSASLTLNPPDLGPLQVVLTVSHTHASADFSAAQPEVRQALQDALPRLREMLADAGIALGQANVHAGTGGDAQQAGQDSSARGGNGGSAQGSSQQAASAIESRSSAPLRQGLGLVNTFA